jgi:hypothetical protein
MADEAPAQVEPAVVPVRPAPAGPGERSTAREQSPAGSSGGERPVSGRHPGPGGAEVVRARLAVLGVFWLCGVICSLWSASLPTVNARLHLGETRSP